MRWWRLNEKEYEVRRKGRSLLSWIGHRGGERVQTLETSTVLTSAVFLHAPVPHEPLVSGGHGSGKGGGRMEVSPEKRGGSKRER